MGVRFHAARGSMSRGESAGGLPPDALVTCAPASAWCSMIDGQPAIQEGQLLRGELPVLIERHNHQSRALLARAGLA